jgi:cyclopropane-fatty-acyl-phospholipid synthase
MSKQIVQKLFNYVDINNYDIKVIDESFYSDILNSKTLGFGEAYMNSKFDTVNLYELCLKLHKLNNLSLQDLFNILNLWDFIYLIKYLFFKFITIIYGYIFNLQSIVLSKKVGKIHYDLPFSLYDKMLDSTMLYSCAYFFAESDLFTAQVQKANLVIDKLHIQNSNNVLDIGCGWGYITYAIAKKYPNCFVTGITISKEQISFCEEKYKLPNLSFQLIDYRELKIDSYDRIYSVGMFEHVGYKNYKDFFDKTYSLLKNEGIMLLHTICKHKQSYNSDPWFEKYIFPGGYLPSISQVIKSTEDTKFNIVDVQEFGLYYSRTLESWLNNFEKNYEELRDTNRIFDEKFYRMWKLYLVFSKVGFDTKYLHLSQFIFTKNNKEVYHR